MTILGGCPSNSRSHVLRGSMVSSTPPMSISSAAAARIARLLDRGRYAKHDGHSRARQRSLKRQTLAAASICGSALSTHSSPPQWLERGGRPVGLIGSTSRPRRIRVRPSRGRHIVQLGYDAQHFAPVAESDAQCLHSGRAGSSYLWNGKSVAYLDRDSDGWWVSSYSVPPGAIVVTDGYHFGGCLFTASSLMSAPQPGFVGMIR